jgi:hypothetical protein
MFTLKNIFCKLLLKKPFYTYIKLINRLVYIYLLLVNGYYILISSIIKFILIENHL